MHGRRVARSELLEPLLGLQGSHVEELGANLQAVVEHVHHVAEHSPLIGYVQQHARVAEADLRHLGDLLILDVEYPRLVEVDPLRDAVGEIGLPLFHLVGGLSLSLGQQRLDGAHRELVRRVIMNAVVDLLQGDPALVVRVVPAAVPGVMLKQAFRFLHGLIQRLAERDSGDRHLQGCDLESLHRLDLAGHQTCKLARELVVVALAHLLVVDLVLLALLVPGRNHVRRCGERS